MQTDESVPAPPRPRLPARLVRLVLLALVASALACDKPPRSAGPDRGCTSGSAIPGKGTKPMTLQSLSDAMGGDNAQVEALAKSLREDANATPTAAD